MDQLKVFKSFSRKESEKLKLRLKSDSVIYFQKNDILGIKYNYEDFKLIDLMSMIPFATMQQFVITPTNLVGVYKLLHQQKFRPTIKYTGEIPHDHKSELENLLKISAINSLSKDVFESLEYLENEYEIYIEGITFFYKKERISINSNGIIYGNNDAYNFADTLLYESKKMNFSVY